MKRKKNIFLGSFLAALMVLSCVPDSSLTAVVSAEETSTSSSSETPVNTNLAADKTVTASAEYSSMPASNLTDDDTSSRWSTEQDAVQWAYVDLGESYDMNYFSIIWESDSVYASAYNIYVSDDTEDWGEPAASRTGNTSGSSEETLDAAVTGRYVKLEVTEMYGYPSVSASDFKVMLKDDSQPVPQDPEENVALGKSAVASSEEASSVTASNAVDGDRTSRDSRWGSAMGDGPHWIYVDLGSVMDVQTVRIYWENRKATDYEIQIAEELSDPMSDEDWETVASFTESPSSTTDSIELDQVYQARYVRLYISDFTSTDPDSGETYNTVSIYEMEIYGGTPAIALSDIGDMITVETPSIDDDSLTVNLPEIEGYTVTYNGTDLEQVVDDDLTIYHPVVDKEVNVSFKIVDDETEEYEFKEIAVTIPGENQTGEGDNAAPEILPELQEWKGGTGSFTITDSSRIIYADDELKSAADEMAEDYLDLTGSEITVISGTEADVQAGDFFFEKTTDTSLGLMDEGYLMEVGDSITVTSETQTGAYWATRTILQALKQSGYTTIPQGTARDYPLYEVRGFILDVGRKTFTMDYLEQIVKEMSWYKMNDFQVHLNDNLISLENKEDPMTAYSAFRLENDTVAEGGYLTDENGEILTVDGEELQYEQDLTSTDLWYTKDEFKDFIQESRELGVNIVPEIDTPAHSLALTKVLPELRYGTTGRNTDHLDLVDSYEQCLTFVQTIFSEYMTEDDPVFDNDTIIHIGADEYNASSTAYREYVNDMLDFVEETGRQARVWGSFTQCAEGEDIDAEGVQINLWNFGYANMDEMYEEGFDLINCNDGNYYIVPNAGYYYDYLSDSTMYELDINTISGVTIPAGDDQMIGGAFAVWNDMTDYLDNGVSEYDVYDRISNMSLFAAKLWGKGDLDLAGAQERADELGDAPRTNFGYEVDSETEEYMNLPMDELEDTSANDYAVSEGENASIVEVDGKNALQLNGGTSYITTDLETAGLGNDLRVKVKRTSDSTDEQILFESSYGSIKAVQTETGQVGFSREGYDYSFNYTLPLNEWVELEFKNELNTIQLYVNGELVDTIGDDEEVEGRPLLATMMFPMSVIGSETNAFIGYVDDVRLGMNDDFASTMELDYALWNASAVLDDSNTDILTPLIEQGKELLTQYDPEAAAIETLAAQLNEAVALYNDETADYSRVQAYIDLFNSSDTSVFTDESVAAVTQVLDSIRYDLPSALQDVVDGYEQSLVEALDGLETKTLTDLYYVDQSTMTATASSYQQDGSDPSNVLDGDTSTMWHTDWTITDMPHWIDLEMEELTTVSGIVYTPRQTGTNGNVTSYRILVSDDGVDYTEAASGTLSSDSSAKEITFGPVTTKHVRLVYDEAVNNNGSAAEIQVVLADIEADIEGLTAAVSDARQILESLNEEDYTAESWNAFSELIAEAEALLSEEEPDANEVAGMIYDLQKQVTQLRLNEDAEEPEETVDKDALGEILDQYSGYHSSDYTPETWEPFMEAYENASAVWTDASATQEEVDAALAALEQAGNALEKASQPSDEDGETTEKPSQEETSGNDSESDVPSSEDGSPSEESGKDTAVQTGVTEPGAALPAVMLFSSAAAGISVIIWKRRSRRKG